MQAFIDQKMPSTLALGEMRKKKNRGSGKSSFACTNCRRRKIRCDAAHPECKTCSIYGEVCEYELVPSLSYVRQLEARIRTLESQVCSLETTSAPSVREDDGLLPRDRAEHMAYTSTDPDNFNLMSCQNLSSISFTAASNHIFGLEDIQYKKGRLIHNAAEQRGLELCKLASLPHRAILLQHPLEIYAHLLRFHWKWIQPFFSFIYRPAFTRGMGSQPARYFSPFLFYSIMTHSSRFCNPSQSLQMYPHFTDQAKKLLPTELEEPSSIPTVQGMLLLSANATSLGLKSQAWTYSGIAFRMLIDMGLHLDSTGSAISDLPEEDTEVQRRLFWSCYLWDKLISLYFGRAPILQSTIHSPPPLFLDDFAENDIWHDGTASTVESVETIQQSYPMGPAYSVSCFIQSCTLSEIINKIIVRFYSSAPAEKALRESTESLTAALLHWKGALPAQIALHFELSQDYCPPSHIATLMYVTDNGTTSFVTVERSTTRLT